MKGFLEDIVKMLGLPEPLSYKYIVASGNTFFLQGIKHIKSYTPECVEIALRRGGVVAVFGEELLVTELNSEEIVVKGRISKVETI